MKLPIGQIICGDCLEIMKGWSDNCVDLIVTDPPYGISYRKSDEVFMVGDTGNVLGLLLPEMYRVLKKDGAIYIFTSFKLLGDWLYRFQMFFKMSNLIIWNKMKNSGLQMGQNYGFSYEMIFYGSKGLHKLNGFCDDLLSIKREQFKQHPTRKPKELMMKFIEMSSNEGDIVLDPFLGSGTVAEASKELKRNYIGIDISEKYCEIARKRIDVAKRNPGFKVFNTAKKTKPKIKRNRLWGKK